MAELALKNIRVLDLSMVWAGPHCTKLLGDFGAEIIKVEAPAHLDSSRGDPKGLAWVGVYPDAEPGERPYNRCGTFNKRNVNKYGVTLNLTTAAGLEVAKRLVKISDVIIDNFAVGVMDRFGLSYEVLKKIKPDIIAVSMPAMGMTGPEKNYVGYGLSVEQLSGIVGITGYLDKVPVESAISYGDPIVGVQAFGCILAALYYRHRTGQGQFIDISHLETTSSMIGDSILDYTMNGRSWQPIGNRHSYLAPYGCYRCRGQDMWIAITICSENQWRRLCELMGNPAWASEARFSNMLRRWHHQDELDALIQAWTVAWDRHELMHHLQRAGIPAGAALQNKEAVENPHLQARSFWREVNHPEAGTHLTWGINWKLSRTPGAISRPAPCFGEHNQHIYKGMLGMADDEIASLEREKVISSVPLG